MKVQARRGGCVKHELQPAGHKRTDIWPGRHAHRQTIWPDACRSDFNPTINCNSPNRVADRNLWLKAPEDILLNPRFDRLSAPAVQQCCNYFMFDWDKEIRKQTKRTAFASLTFSVDSLRGRALQLFADGGGNTATAAAEDDEEDEEGEPDVNRVTLMWPVQTLLPKDVREETETPRRHSSCKALGHTHFLCSLLTGRI